MNTVCPLYSTLLHIIVVFIIVEYCGTNRVHSLQPPKFICTTVRCFPEISMINKFGHTKESTAQVRFNHIYSISCRHQRNVSFVDF